MFNERDVTNEIISIEGNNRSEFSPNRRIWNLRLKSDMVTLFRYIYIYRARDERKKKSRSLVRYVAEARDHV